MSDINTNLSVSPYWDDYNPLKQYYRVLFIPKRAVQVREMNQLQTMVQKQISRFADHIFKDGSIVAGCNITYIPKLKFARLRQYNSIVGNTAFSTSDLNEMLVVSPTTGLRASIQLAEPGFTNAYPDTNTLFINYLNKGRDSGDNEVTEFIPGETVALYDRSQDKMGALNPGLLYNTIDLIPGLNGQEATGEAYAVSVGDGIVYQKGYFVNTLPHTILVNKYSTDVSNKLVGFDTLESVVSYLQDPTLIDPADTSNRNGIGANRLRLNPVLVSRDRDSIDATDDFFPIIEFGKEDAPVKQNTDPEYSLLGDHLAKQKYETNGDFYTKPFIISTKEVANTNNFAYTLDGGIAYAKGNRVQLLNTLTLEQPRATDIGFTNNNITTLNYGSYVVVDQLVGTFNADKLVTVSIRDAVQTAVTAGRTPGTAVGTQRGTANIRAVMFDSGVKGDSNGRYRLYLTNIRMNSGRSFANDAKSIVITSVNNGLAEGALADIVLTNGKAALIDSSSSGLIFPTGVTGSRRLRDSIGTNDTTFTFRDTSTATLQANGHVTFTLNSPYAGGTERFFSSIGALTNANKNRIDITTTAAIQTADLTGTVDGNSGNTSIIGVGTTFTSDFSVGERIRISSTDYRITNISNNTLMTVHTNVTGGGASDSYSKFIPALSVLNLNNATVNAVSNTQFTVGIGTTVASGAPQTLIATYPVIRGEAYEIKKDVHYGTFVRINCSSNTTGPFNLGLVDVFSISNVYVGTTYSENNPDRSGWFMLDSGQESTHYEHAKLVLKPEYQGKLTTSTRILVKLNHFTANTVAGIGFFSVDSYPTREPGQVANTTNISYDDIPEVGGISLRNAIDFRPQKFNTATITTVPGSGTQNPTASNTSFNINAGAGSYLGEPNSNFTADVEYYLSRRDIIQVNKDGIFTVKSSVPDVKPTTPFADNDAMIIGTALVPPYPGITADVSYLYPAGKPRITTNLTGIRGYTMRDINALDKRITTLEYYQALSMLEQSAKDYSVKDENGLDRFKNGIFANPLKNHLLSDVSNFEYNIAIDEGRQHARPRFKKNNVDLDVDLASSTNIKTTGRVAMLDYTSEQLISQPFATKYRNVVDSVWKWNGSLQLFPEFDHYRDETTLPDINVSVDLSSPWEQFANSPFGTNFGDWRVQSSSSITETTFTPAPSVFNQWGVVRWNNLMGGEDTTTTTTTTASDRTVTHLDILGTSQTKYDMGTYVADVSLNPFMRSRQIAFVASGLTPNARFWVFFADEQVSQYCAPGALDTNYYDQATGELTLSAGREDLVVRRTGEFGAPLVTDQFGNLYGVFNIPAQKFRVGERKMVVIDTDDITLGRDAILSSAAATYTASSLNVSTRSTSITTVEPRLSTRTSTESNISVTSSSTVVQRPAVESGFITGAAAPGDGPGGNGTGGDDPLGQTFYIENSGRSPGKFLESIEVFFRSKDPNMGITCYVTEVIAGVPDPNRVLATSYLKSTSINVSSDSSAPTRFHFADVPYLEREKYYAFFLRPDGDSPEYLLWVSEIGDTDILTGIKIFSNPYVGVMVKSANSNTWDALQTEDIKFNAYFCNFNTDSPGQLYFHEQDDEYFTVEGFAYANTQTVMRTGDVVYTAHANGMPRTGVNDPMGILQEYDTVNDTLVIDSSTGGFTANTAINIYRPTNMNNPSAVNASTLIATSKIVSIDNIEYSVVVPNISSTTLAGTNISYHYKGRSAANIQDANWKSVMSEAELEMVDQIRVIRSKSNRSAPDVRGASIRLELNSTNRYVSPVVNLRKRSLYAIDNIVNNDITDEHTRYGKGLARYISPAITLAEGQDAEDIKVLLTAYRPSGTDVHVYLKILSGDDPDQFYDKLWTKLDLTEGVGMYSSTTDVNDYREYGYSIPTTEEMQGTAFLNAGNNGIVQYRNSTGAIFVSYKTFALKFVLTSTAKQRVPRVDDIRALCLQI